MDRLLLTLGTFAFAGVVYALMLRGWHRRQNRQADLPAPPAAGVGTPLGAPVSGLFIGTTDAGHWLDRIAVHHLADRADAVLHVTTGGVHVERQGLPELFLPWDSIESVTIETSLAGKVVSSGMLLVGWRLGERSLVSGFRADDRAAHEPLRVLIADHMPLEVA